MAFLEIDGIKKNFNNLEILKGISLKLDEGEVLSIIGSSGGGKTTLLRCINFLELADEGKILLKNKEIYNGIKDKNIKESELREKRKHFGLVFQSFNLFPQYTVFQNVKLPLELKEKEKRKNGLSFLTEQAIGEEALTILKKVGMYEKKDYYPCQLSGGQQQRVAIARAMVLKPDILCFDEPTSALDPELTNEVLKVIMELKTKLKITMIIVTHEMEFAKNISDKVLFLYNGTVGEIGSSEEIFNNPKESTTEQFLYSFRKMN